MSDKTTIPQKPPYNPNNDPFLELPQVIVLQTEVDAYMAARRFELLERLKERGRDKPISPDDEDQMRWYNECAENSLKQYHRGMAVLRELYRRGEL